MVARFDISARFEIEPLLDFYRAIFESRRHAAANLRQLAMPPHRAGQYLGGARNNRLKSNNGELSASQLRASPMFFAAGAHRETIYTAARIISYAPIHARRVC